MRDTVRIGTAGWTIPRQCADAFAAQGSHLERYARRFSCVEINSSFYRSHKPGTYARWAASVPPDFRFAVKMPRDITHIRKLVGITEPLDRFVSDIAALGHTLGPILVQLPPSLRYDPAIAAPFLATLRERFDGDVVCEPRHPSWFSDDAETALANHRIARVAADPAPVPGAAEPGAWHGIVYRRLHGSPRIYYSAYTDAGLDATARAMRKRQSWCIFDNTASGEACNDALRLSARLGLRDTVREVRPAAARVTVQR